jgi:hypothetical protein
MIALSLPLTNTGVMNKAITTALGLIAGFIGGAMSHYVFVPTPVLAQPPVQSPLEIRAQKFVLVDENGTARGVFGFQRDGSPELQKYGTGNDVFTARWIGINLRRNVLPDLRPAEPPKAGRATGSK